MKNLDQHRGAEGGGEGVAEAAAYLGHERIYEPVGAIRSRYLDGANEAVKALGGVLQIDPNGLSTSDGAVKGLLESCQARKRVNDGDCPGPRDRRERAGEGLECCRCVFAAGWRNRQGFGAGELRLGVFVHDLA